MFDFLKDTDIALRIAFALSIHGLALLTVGALALLVGAGAARALGDTGPRWRWFGWFGVFKGLAIVGSLALGIADGSRSPDFFRGLYLALSLPAWWAGAQFAWRSWSKRPAWATTRIPTFFWLGGVALSALLSGLPSLTTLHTAMAGGIGVAMLGTLVHEIRALDRRGRARAAISLLLVMAGLGGLIGLDLLGERTFDRAQGWTLNTLPLFSEQDFTIVVTGCVCALALALGWWLWMRLHVKRIAAAIWLRRALWLVPAGLLSICIVGFALLNHVKITGSERADRIFELRARTIVAGLDLAGGRERFNTPERLGPALRAMAEKNPDIDAIAHVRVVGGRLETLVNTSPIHDLPDRPPLWRERNAPDPRFIHARAAFGSSFMQDKAGTFFLLCEPWPRPGEGWIVFRISFGAWARTMGPVLMLATFLILLACIISLSVVVLLIQRELAAETRLDYARAAFASQAKSELLARASHELRTPIQGVLGYADLLERSALDLRQLEWLASLRGQGAHLLRLVNDLLDFGALQNGRLTMETGPVSPVEVAREALAAVLPQAEARRLACTLDIEPGVPAWVTGDPTRLRQILVNLLGNAVKFTGSGGVSLQVHAREQALPDGRVRLAFVVADTGPGIDEDGLKSLFDPRDRQRRHPNEGAGLGLALTRSLCEIMDGELRVESEPGRGSTFTAVVALPPTSAPAEETRAPSVRRLPALGLRVLVVEDNTALRRLLAAWLDELGCAAALAPDGETALATSRRQPFDAIILDLGLPDLDGCEVARRLRADARRPRPWIVGLSAHASEADRARALAAGMDLFLSKPVELDALAAALRGRPSAKTVPQGLLNSPLLSPAQARAIRAAARDETPARLSDLQNAIEAADWTKVAKSAHYLANTADVLGDSALLAACHACESAARAEDGTLAIRAASEVVRLGKRLAAASS